MTKEAYNIGGNVYVQYQDDVLEIFASTRDNYIRDQIFLTKDMIHKIHEYMKGAQK